MVQPEYRRIPYSLVYCTSKEVFGYSLGFRNIPNYVQGLDLKNAIRTLIRIAWFLDENNESDVATQLELARQLLPSHRQGAARQLVMQQGRIIFFRAQIYILIKYLLIFGSDNNKAVESEELKTIGACLLSVTELISSQVKDRKRGKQIESQTLNTLTHEIVTSSFFLGKFSIPTIRLLMVRARYMFKTIHTRLKNESSVGRNYLDIDHFFEESIGIQLNEYLNLGISLIVYFLQFLEKGSPLLDENFPYIFPKKLFSESIVEEKKVNIFFNFLSTTFSHSRSELQASFSREQRREFVYDFLYLRSNPLLQINSEIFIPFSLPFLFERITSGIFWQVLDHLNLKYERKVSDRFTRYHGRIFQIYVEEFIQKIYQQNPTKGEQLVQEQTFRIGKQEGKTPDIMIFGSDYAVFFEASATRMQAKGTVGLGERSAFDSDFQKMILHNAKSLDSFIEKFRNGLISIEDIDPRKIKFYYPVIITIESFAGQNSIIYPFLKRKLKDSQLLIDKDIAGLTILEISDIEYLEGYVNATLIDVLKSWHSQSNELLPDQHFKDHIKSFPEKDESFKTLLSQITDIAFDEAIQFMFNLKQSES